MEIINFGASFLTFRVDWEKQPSQTASHKPPFTLNNARIQIEAVCNITDLSVGATTQYVLGAACKTEYVGVDQGIWTVPNADFCIILSNEKFLILKSWDRNDKGVMRYPPSLGIQPERQSGLVVDSYDNVKINLWTYPGEELTSTEAIVQATLDDAILVGRVVYTIGERYSVSTDCPIKTMNANNREMIYQTDTGPILFPDFSIDRHDLIETFRLAYVAYNCPEWAEFIVQVPTPLDENVSVNHYSKRQRLDSANSVFRVI